MLVTNRAQRAWSGVCVLGVPLMISLALLATGCHSGSDERELEPRQTQQLISEMLEEARQAGVPEGVEPQVYGELLNELTRVLEAEGVNKLTSAPPTGEMNVIEVSYQDNDLESFSLSWDYKNSGDFDGNSEVNIADLSVIGKHFGKREGHKDWINLASVADGDGNGEVNIADVTTIGKNFGRNLGGYNVYCAPDATAEPELIGTMNFADIVDPTKPLVFIEPFTPVEGSTVAFDNLIYSVVPFDGDGAEPAAPYEPATVQGDQIVIYSSTFIDDYAKLVWRNDPAGADGIQPPLPDWFHARFLALTPAVQPPPPAEQETHEFVGRALPQQMEARFNLTKGTGKIQLSSEDGLTVSRLRGGEGAFSLEMTADVAAKAPFSQESKLATPFVIINSDGALVSVEEYSAGGTDYATEMTDVRSMVGVFFSANPTGGLAADLPPWAEKWCIIQDMTGKIPDLQEY